MAEEKGKIQGVLKGVEILEGPVKKGSVEVLKGKVSQGEKIFVLEMLKRADQPNGEFLPAGVCDGEETFLWSYRQERSSMGKFYGIAKFFFIEDEYVIGLVSGKFIIRVIPLLDLAKRKAVDTEEGVQFIGGRDIVELLNLKRSLAKREKIQVFFEPIERQVADKIDAFNLKKKEDAMRQKFAEQAAKRKEILIRPEIIVFSENGKRYRGIPVIEEEQEMLPNNTPLIVVESYGEGKAGLPKEAFIVIKASSSGRFAKKNKSEGSLSYEKGGKIEVLIFFQGFLLKSCKASLTAAQKLLLK